jgi:hypothetical protein
MPKAAASPAFLEREIEIRETRTKLGPGLMAPIASVAAIVRNTVIDDIR